MEFVDAADAGYVVPAYTAQSNLEAVTLDASMIGRAIRDSEAPAQPKAVRS